MSTFFKHGDRVRWNLPKNGSKTIMIEKEGTYIRHVENKDSGYVFVLFDGNKTKTKAPVYELSIIL